MPLKYERKSYRNSDYIFSLPFVYPSRNVTEPMHWAKRKRLHDQYQQNVVAVLQAGEIVCFDCPVRISIDLCFKTKREYKRDFDNWQPKWLMDALVKIGVLPDDNSKVIVEPSDLLFLDKEPENKTIVKIECVKT